MKPTGAAAGKKSRSKAFRRSPEQPKTTARGASSGNDAPDIAPLQFIADPLCIRDRAGLDPIEYALIAEIGADRRSRNACEQICVCPLDAIPLLACDVFAAYRAELDTRPMRVCRRLLSGCRFRRPCRCRG